ncbi:unnamed protein product [Mucor hiemalis]
MSKVSLKNELLPSFEPIEHKPASQKRKRVVPGTVSLEDALTNTENQRVIKKSRAKKNNIPPAPTTNTFVWVGATLMQEEDSGNDATSESSAAFSVYYGSNDSRNYTEKFTIDQKQNLDHVYALGVIRALENSIDDSSNLHINTSSKLLQTVIENSTEVGDNSIYNQLKEKIANRKGSTSIHFQAQSSATVDELNLAHTLAHEKLSEDKMMVDDEETLVDSLEVTEMEVTITTTTVETAITKDENDEEVENSVVTSIEEEVITSSVAEPIPSTSWAYTLNFRNLLDILKAPFSRKK